MVVFMSIFYNEDIFMIDEKSKRLEIPGQITIFVD